METIVLSGGGGLLGAVMGIRLTLCVAQVFELPTILRAWSPMLAFAVLLGVGVIFGLYTPPAARLAWTRLKLSATYDSAARASRQSDRWYRARCTVKWSSQLRNDAEEAFAGDSINSCQWFLCCVHSQITGKICVPKAASTNPSKATIPAKTATVVHVPLFHGAEAGAVLWQYGQTTASLSSGESQLGQLVRPMNMMIPAVEDPCGN